MNILAHNNVSSWEHHTRIQIHIGPQLHQLPKQNKYHTTRTVMHAATPAKTQLHQPPKQYTSDSSKQTDSGLSLLAQTSLGYSARPSFRFPYISL